MYPSDPVGGGDDIERHSYRDYRKDPELRHDTVCRCVHIWNNHGLEGTLDCQGGSGARLTSKAG